MNRRKIIIVPKATGMEMEFGIREDFGAYEDGRLYEPLGRLDAPDPMPAGYMRAGIAVEDMAVMASAWRGA